MEQNIRKNEPMIPVYVVKKYLLGVLDEWEALGDRKYELPNMQVYNHTRKELDDLEAWIATNCRAKKELHVVHVRCEEGLCPICGGKLSYVDTAPDYNWWHCPSCNATGKEGKDYVDGDAVFDGEHYDVYDGNGDPIDIQPPLHQEGICPVCGEDIEYGDFEMHDEGATYDWECPKCGATGKEGYDLTFDGNHYNVCDADGNEIAI
jgi:rubredoxin